MAQAATAYDAVIVGAGFSGLYMLHRLREQGLAARVYEADEVAAGGDQGFALSSDGWA